MGEVSVEPLPQTSYGLLAASLIRDSLCIMQGSETSCIRIGRIISSMFLVLATLLVQFCLVHAVGSVLATPSVILTRQIYDDFERSVYERTTRSVHGYARGVLG